MDACIIICRTNKPAERKGKIQFIDAKSEVTRKNAESYLEPKHIEKIAKAYFEFAEIDRFSKIFDNDEILNHNAKLSVALYVKNNNFADNFDLDLEEEVEDLFAQLVNDNEAVCELLKML